MLHLLKTTENQDFGMALTSADSLLPATFRDLRFGITFIFLSKADIIDGGEGSSSSHGSSTHKSYPFFCVFEHTVMN
jgi:hypothetical protein